jgi:hypothetical protein
VLTEALLFLQLLLLGSGQHYKHQQGEYDIWLEFHDVAVFVVAVAALVCLIFLRITANYYITAPGSSLRPKCRKSAENLPDASTT